MKQHIISAFRKQFNSEPNVYASPGRINIIGEHTDYNEGFVLPAAIDKEIYFAISLNKEKTIRMFSYNMNQSVEISTDKIQPIETAWANYFIGVIAQLKKRHIEPVGFNMVFGGNIPIGSGLSTSAAIECGLLYALNDLLKLNLPTKEMVQIAQIAEHEYAGVMCGIMDQYAVMFGKANSAIMLDCNSNTHEYFPLKLDGYSFVLLDSKVKHSLAATEYNVRRNECEHAIDIINKNIPVSSLRDVTFEILTKHKHLLSSKEYRRCEYVIEENTRVAETCKALEQGNLKMVGELMYASHHGLSTKYEVSCKELDELVELAKKCKGVLGSRMMGGGFGGCTINLVNDANKASFIDFITTHFYKKKQLEPNIIEAKINEGTRKLSGY